MGTLLQLQRLVTKIRVSTYDVVIHQITVGGLCAEYSIKAIKLGYMQGWSMVSSKWLAYQGLAWLHEVDWWVGLFVGISKWSLAV